MFELHKNFYEQLFYIYPHQPEKLQEVFTREKINMMKLHADYTSHLPVNEKVINNLKKDHISVKKDLEARALNDIMEIISNSIDFRHFNKI